MINGNSVSPRGINYRVINYIIFNKHKKLYKYNMKTDIKNILYSLESLIDSEQESEICLEEIDNLEIYIYNLENSLETRIKAIELYYNKNKDNDNIVEIINKLVGMYIFSGTKALEIYINELCINSNLPLKYKLLLVDALITEIYTRDETSSPSTKSESKYKISKYGYDTLNKICHIFTTNESNDISTTIKINNIKILMKCDKYRNESIIYFTSILKNINIGIDFKYKSILSLENEKNLEDTKKIYLKELLYIFFSNIEDNTLDILRYKLLSGQCILQKKLYDNINEFKYICETILNISKNLDIDYNIRADSCDIILRLESSIKENDYEISIYKEFLKEARNNINLLGTNGNLNIKTIYDNAQNIHILELEESIVKGIEFLNNLYNEIKNKEYRNCDKNNFSSSGNECNFNYIVEKINEKLKETELYKYQHSINISLNRINIDRALYSKYNITLLGILIKLWIYIESRNVDEKQQLLLRLLQELIDMSETCSTGYAGRLINVLSGFSDFNFTISWEQQIISNFVGRMNARIRDIPIEWNNTKRLIIIVNSIISSDSVLENEILLKYCIKNKSENLITKFNVTFIENTTQLKINKNELKHEILKNFKFEDYPDYKLKLYNFLKELYVLPNQVEKYKLYIENKNKDEIMNILYDFQEKVLNELDVNVKDRSHFRIFTREIFLSITEELYNEFKDYICDEDYNLYIRKAILTYEGV